MNKHKISFMILAAALVVAPFVSGCGGDNKLTDDQKKTMNGDPNFNRGPVIAKAVADYAKKPPVVFKDKNGNVVGAPANGATAPPPPMK